MSSRYSTIFLDNDSLLVLSGLRDRAGNLIIDATVTLESLLDKRGHDVDGLTTPVGLNADGEGNYELLLPKELAFVAERFYYANVKAVASGLTGEWAETLMAQRRTA